MICFIEKENNIQFFWHDVISRILDLSIGILRKDNFFSKIANLKIVYYLILPINYKIENIMIFFTFLGFLFINYRILNKFFKTYFFFFYIL